MVRRRSERLTRQTRRVRSAEVGTERSDPCGDNTGDRADRHEHDLGTEARRMLEEKLRDDGAATNGCKELT